MRGLLPNSMAGVTIALFACSGPVQQQIEDSPAPVEGPTDPQDAVPAKLAARNKLSPATEECIECHSQVTPGIVADWAKSLHAVTSPVAALAKPEAERRMSVAEPPAGIGDFVVGCAECHTLNPETHRDTVDHQGHDMHVVVTPRDCETCHPTEVHEYSGTKKAHAVGILADNPLFTTLVEGALGVDHVSPHGVVTTSPSSDHTRGQACYGCHGTDVKVKGTKIIDDEEYGETAVPDLSGWPNQGVGRLNPDGTMGSCTSCHPRHSFSIAIARKPETCAQCHLEPDVPAYNVYMESKHGNIYKSQAAEMNFHAVPWVVGRDFQVPTCATCHVSEVRDAEGSVINARSHDFGGRLWVRIFGLPYAHPQPIDGNTAKIVNDDGMPLPTTLDGKPASKYLINADEQAARKGKMKAVCTSCHSSNWADGHFAALDTTIKETNAMTATTTGVMKEAWKAKIVDPTNPFDEKLELKWIRQWLFYGSSVRYAAAMSGPDYAAFKNGWWYLNETLRQIVEEVEAKKAEKKTRGAR